MRSSVRHPLPFWWRRPQDFDPPSYSVVEKQLNWSVNLWGDTPCHANPTHESYYGKFRALANLAWKIWQDQTHTLFFSIYYFSFKIITVEIQVLYNKPCPLTVYKSVNFNKCKHPWTHRYNQGVDIRSLTPATYEFCIFVTIDYFAISRILYKWKHTLWSLLFLATSTQHTVFDSSILLHVSLAGFFLVLSTISFYEYTAFCLFIHLLTHI